MPMRKPAAWITVAGRESTVYRPDGTPVPGTGDSFETSSSPIKGREMQNAEQRIAELERAVEALEGDGEVPGSFKPVVPYYADNEAETAENDTDAVEDGQGRRFMPTSDPYDS